MFYTFLRHITASILILACMSLMAQEPSERMVRGDAHPSAHPVPDMPSYVLVVDDGCEITTYRVPDSLFNAIAGRTIFRVNRTEINPADPFLHELIDSVIPQANSQEWMLVGIDLRGAASPEGPYANNQRLSRGRSQALLDLMSTRLDSVQVSAANITLVAEDYQHLLWLMRRDGDPQAETVAHIIDRWSLDNPAAIKRDLRSYDGGKLWARLYQTYFPTLRAARVVLFFRRISPKRECPALSAAPEPRVDLRLELPEVQPMARPAARAPRRHLLAVGTNLLYDAFYMPNYGWAPMPNLQLEFFPRRGNFTFLAAFLCPYYHRWHSQQFFQIRDYRLEARRYFNPGLRHRGLYLAASVNANKYGIGLSATKGWEGEGWGGAVKLGYAISLGGRWRLDVHLAAGYYTTRYDPYVYGNPITGAIDGDYYYDYTGKQEDFMRRNHRFTWLGPTEVGLTITYDIMFYKNNQSKH